MQTATEKRICIHCGTPFRQTAHRVDFCCAGCQFVHGLIAKNGLGQFYDLQENGAAPAPSLVFQKRDFTWLEELAAEANGTLELDVQGLSCIACAWLIEKLFSRQAGGLSIHVDATLGRIALRWQPGAFDVVTFARELQSFGYLVGPLGEASRSNGRALNLRLGLCAALAMNTMLFTVPRYFGMSGDFQFAPLFERLSLILGSLSFLIGGSYFFSRTWRSLRQRVLHIDLPISLGLIAAYSGSLLAWTRQAHDLLYFDFVATFTFLMLAGRWLQLKAVERNRHQLLNGRIDPTPVRAASGETMAVAPIEPGDAYQIDPGQIVPVQSRLQSEGAMLGMEWINGESEATLARRGRLIPAGAVNCNVSGIELEACEHWRDSMLAKLLRIAPTASNRDATFEQFLRRYIVIVLLLAAAGFTTWWSATGQWLVALQVMISVLVVSCPCASGVALPLCRDLAANQLRRLGVFIRDGEVWSRLGQVRKILFDKTGTLTAESISLRNPEVLARLGEEERATLLAMVQDSRHPVAGCIREELLADRVEPGPGGNVRESVGFGLEIQDDTSCWRLGRAAWAATTNATKSECVFSKDGEVLADFRFGEAARDDATEVVGQLRASGREVFILSGDRRTKVDAMAGHLGIPVEQCYGELSPEQKAAQVRKLDARDTLFVGDGANDSRAFDAAWISGTPAIDRGLLEQKAAFYFLGRGLHGVRALLETAELRRRVAWRVVAFALTYNAVAVVICLAGRMNPLLAAILMPASSLVSLGIVLQGFAGKSAARNERP